jgi:GntR family transcriptional regulator
MTLLRIDPESAIPVYRQIVDGLRIALVNGELVPGNVLPPVRRLALDLGVHFNTVAQAYRALSSEGWLQISARSGVAVKSRATPSESQPDLTALRRRLEELGAQMLARGTRRAVLARELRRMADGLEKS